MSFRYVTGLKTQSNHLMTNVTRNIVDGLPIKDLRQDQS